MLLLSSILKIQIIDTFTENDGNNLCAPFFQFVKFGCDNETLFTQIFIYPATYVINNKLC